MLIALSFPRKLCYNISYKRLVTVKNAVLSIGETIMILDYVSGTSALPFEQQIAQNFTPELSWSPNFMIGIVLRGSLSIHYKNHTRQFGLHDIYFFPPFETFSVIDSDAHTQVLLLVADSGYISQLCADVSRLALRQNHIHKDLGNPTYTGICEEIAVIIFNNLKQELCSKLKLISAITHIITLLLESYGVLKEEALKADLYTQRSIQILDYIKTHYADKLTVTEIASHLGLHPQYFSTLFHKEFGTSFIEYLTTYRVNQSISDLVHTNQSILEIALNHGFNNHKTYATAFRKLYGCAPMEYRRTHHVYTEPEPPEFMNPDATSDTIGIFAYFRQFLHKDHLAPAAGNVRQQQMLELDTAALSRGAFLTDHEHFLSVGRAYACLRSEVQEQIRQAKKDYDFTYLRFRDIFSDDLYVYYEDENKQPLYSWQSLDSVFDFIISIGAKPFPEIGYMPQFLASKRQFAGIQYHPNTSAPKSLSRWKEMIKLFLMHYAERYGLEEMRKWRFDFWTSPDLEIRDPYWSDGMEAFFSFYKVTYEAFQEVDGGLRLGTPNFSVISGYPWYEAFFQFCYTNKIYPSHVSIHIYGAEQKKSDIRYDTFREIKADDFSITDQDYIGKQLAHVHQIMNRLGFRSLDVILSDWNLTFLPKDLIRDTCYMGPFICHTVIQNLSLYKGHCFWSLSDIHEDAFPESRMFTGGPGMLDYHGLKKASYNAIVLLGKLGRRILKVGPNYIFTQDGSRYQLLVYNLAAFDDMFSLIDRSAIDASHRYSIYVNSDSLYLNIAITLPKGAYYVKKSEVNRRYGSAYDLWGDIGAPAVLHKDIEDYIRESSVPHITYTVHNVDYALLLDEEVPCHGVMLLEIIPR